VTGGYYSNKKLNNRLREKAAFKTLTINPVTHIPGPPIEEEAPVLDPSSPFKVSRKPPLYAQSDEDINLILFKKDGSPEKNLTVTKSMIHDKT